MLTIHGCTFQVSWTGWGPFTVHAERVAVDIMVELQEMSPEGVQRLARSPRELNLTGRVARARLPDPLTMFQRASSRLSGQALLRAMSARGTGALFGQQVRVQGARIGGVSWAGLGRVSAGAYCA